jgi:tungstate transport system substrate-binding protein
MHVSRSVKGKALLILSLMLMLVVSACSATPVVGKSQLKDESITLATTTSVNDSGLLEYLNPILREDTGINMDIVSQGTGQAIQTAVDGNADVLFVHAKASEEKFIADGFGLERIELMYNYFVIAGPKDDVAGIKGSNLTASDALKKVSEKGAKFVSRGDDSGTHKKELALWKAVAIEPKGDWYVSAGKGMGAVLTMADEMQAYTLTDKATFLSMKDDLDLEIVLEQQPDLKNQYTLIEVNPAKHPSTNTEAVKAFIEWITSDKVLKLLDEYGVKEYGEALFRVNYTK